jgi:hypothetical protein
MKYGFLKRPKSKNWNNGNAKGRKTGLSRTGTIVRVQRNPEVDASPPPILDGNREYLAANCVVLAAAIFAEPWAKQWAEDLLPQARLLDGRTHRS